MALSSSGLGRRPLTAETRVRVPDALLTKRLLIVDIRSFFVIHTSFV